MKNITYTLLGILIVLFEITILNKTKIFGISPCISLLYVSYLSLFIEKDRGVIIAAIIGLWRDTSIEGILGIYAFVYAISSYISGKIEYRLYVEKISTPLLIGLISTSIYAICAWLSAIKFGSGSRLWDGIVVIFMLILFHSFIGPMIYFPIKNTVKTIERQWR